MKVILAGFNVETAVLEDARKRFGDAVTPEVISASYARISRDPRSIAALREEARKTVEEARRMNERIVFGLGHASVAEHACMNFDLAGISRLAVEEIEHFRLASFTEKSQRYVRLGKDVILPREIKSSGLEKEFRSHVKHLHAAY
ncbi:MAG: FAD-dependent thymidylate synthase, partial [Candidatus Krumholzibacteria bacterium]|nr:FAD-dependent thymidylate synthase [Candidatus Krumholzibacteria bacterium]